MTDWSIYIETAAPTPTPPTTIEPDAVDNLLDLLADHAPICSAGHTSWDIRLSVTADTPTDATTQATDLVTAATTKAGLPPWPICRLETTRDDILEADNARPVLPDLAGTHEVTERLGFTRQRLHNLRADGRFPQPILTISGAPIWLSATIDAFAATWDSTPGRRRPAS